MRGVYTVVFSEQTVAAASGDYDLFEFDAAADKPIELVALYLSNKSETGDAAEEMVSWSIRYFSGGTFTSSNGTSTTPRLTDPSDVAASFTAETVGSSVATTTGTEIIRHSDTFNIRVGLQMIFPVDMRHKCDGAANSAMTVRLNTALIDDATMSGTAYIREI